MNKLLPQGSSIISRYSTTFYLIIKLLHKRKTVQLKEINFRETERGWGIIAFVQLPKHCTASYRIWTSKSAKSLKDDETRDVYRFIVLILLCVQCRLQFITIYFIMFYILVTQFTVYSFFRTFLSILYSFYLYLFDFRVFLSLLICRVYDFFLFF